MRWSQQGAYVVCQLQVLFRQRVYLLKGILASTSRQKTLRQTGHRGTFSTKNDAHSRSSLRSFERRTAEKRK